MKSPGRRSEEKTLLCEALLSFGVWRPPNILRPPSSPSTKGDCGVRDIPRARENCAAVGVSPIENAAAVGVEVTTVAFGGPGKANRLTAGVRGPLLRELCEWKLRREGAGEATSWKGVGGGAVTFEGRGERSWSRCGIVKMKTSEFVAEAVSRGLSVWSSRLSDCAIGLSASEASSTDSTMISAGRLPRRE